MQDVAIYFAALAKPGQWSVPYRSLSIVFGTPITRHSQPLFAMNLLILSQVSMESLPPL